MMELLRRQAIEEADRREYLPKYELFVSTQKIARGSITLS